MKIRFNSLHVILSGAHFRKAKMCGVEGSHVVHLSGKLHEILRLRKTLLSLRFAALRMTV
jgi:hypothetical protein